MVADPLFLLKCLENFIAIRLDVDIFVNARRVVGFLQVGRSRARQEDCRVRQSLMKFRGECGNNFGISRVGRANDNRVRARLFSRRRRLVDSRKAVVAQNLERADLQKASGEICAGFVLRNGSHVREEDFNVVTRLGFKFLSLLAQGLETFAPTVRLDIFNLLNFRRAESFAKFGSRRALFRRRND